MSAMKTIDRWWSKRAPVLVGVALLFLACMTVVLYVGQLQDDVTSEKQDTRIANLQSQSDSLGQALDNQRAAAKVGGADVVVPPSDTIKKNPEIITIPGERGSDGSDGKDGLDGKPGKPGSDATGSPGSDGTDGSDGSDGTDGKNGEPGTDGANGLNGTDGTDGKDGENGKDGADGTDGEDGKDGKSPSQIRIRIGAITYVCSPDESGSSVYTCNPEISTGGSRASAAKDKQPARAPSRDDSEPFSAALLPWATDRKMLVRWSK